MNRQIIVRKGRQYDGEQDIVVSDGENTIKIGTIYEFGSNKDDIIDKLNELLKRL